MHDRINRLFDESFGSYPAIKEEPVEKTWSPLVDIYEDKDTITVKVELPGMQKEDVSIGIKASANSVESCPAEMDCKSDVAPETKKGVSVGI